MELDFSLLDDDQLLQLIQGGMAEAVTRGTQLRYAAEKSFQEAAANMAKNAATVAAQVEQEIKDRQAKEQLEKQKRLWAKKRAIFDALLMHPTFSDELESGKDFQVNIWARNAEKKEDVRLYIQPTSGSAWEIVFYSTGNHRNPANSIEGVEGEKSRAELMAFCQTLCSKWNSLKVTRLKAEQFTETHPAGEKDFQDYQNALKPGIERFNARRAKELAFLKGAAELFDIPLESVRLSLVKKGGDWLGVFNSQDKVCTERREKYIDNEPELTAPKGKKRAFSKFGKIIRQHYKTVEVEYGDAYYEGISPDAEVLQSLGVGHG